jgi:hypothetical protein
MKNIELMNFFKQKNKIKILNKKVKNNQFNKIRCCKQYLRNQVQIKI